MYRHLSYHKTLQSVIYSEHYDDACFDKQSILNVGVIPTKTQNTMYYYISNVHRIWVLTNVSVLTETFLPLSCKCVT